MQKVTWFLIVLNWLRTRWQPNSFFFKLLLHNNAIDSALARCTEFLCHSFLFLLTSLLILFLFPSSLCLSETHRSFLPDQNGSVCRGREKRRIAWETEMLGSQKNEVGGVAVWQRAVMMSHLLQDDRIATESWHGPLSPGEGRKEGGTKNHEKKGFSNTSHLGLWEMCKLQNL